MAVPMDISLRDYFAGQALTGILSRNLLVANEASWLAYGAADRMLAWREKDGRRRDHEIEELTRRAEKAETSLEVLRIKIEELRGGVKVCLDAERERRASLKPGAPATTYTEARIAMLESLLA